MPLIGGNTSDMQSAAGRFMATGSETFARGSEISAFAKGQSGEYDVLSSALIAHIQAKAGECQAQARQMRAAFEGLQWSGRARAVVDQAETQLQVSLNRVLDSIHVTAQDFKARLAAFVSGYEQEIINGQFLPSMQNLKTTYEQIGTATQKVAEGFEQADSAVSLG